MSIRHATPSRRTIAKGAAWSVPAVAVAASAPSLAASPGECPEESVTTTVTYAVRLTNEGLARDLGDWTAEVTSSLPACVQSGASVPAPPLAITLTTTAEAADLLRSLGNTSIEGTAEASSTASGSVVDPGARTSTLTVPLTQIPETGAIVAEATGNGPEETAGSAGAYTITLAGFTASLTTNTGFVLTLAGELNPADQDAELGTITVQ